MALPQALRFCRVFVRSDAIDWFLQTWQRTLATSASLLHVTTIPTGGPITTLNLTAAVQAIDAVIAGKMEPALPRKFGFLRFFQFLESVKSKIGNDKAQGLILREKSVVHHSPCAYSIYISAEVVATEQNDIRRNRQMGWRFHQFSVESPLLLTVFTKTADTFAYVLTPSDLSAFTKLTSSRDPKKADESTFAVLAPRAREDIPKELRDVCQFLTTKVEEAIVSGASYSQYLWQGMADQIRQHLI
ncbi:hypothetical protein CDD83_6333 [Cordyceps sp. RAO-2017]|nr:hypothetical protein CDD83_6333 [Cordyceps sp. RAO-2017]